MLNLTLLTAIDPYLILRLDDETKVLSILKISRLLKKHFQTNNIDGFLLLDKTKFLYYVNKVISIHYLSISLSVALDIFAIAYKEGHPNFSC